MLVKPDACPECAWENVLPVDEATSSLAKETVTKYWAKDGQLLAQEFEKVFIIQKKCQWGHEWEVKDVRSYGVTHAVVP